ncbi:MAG: hypothetical protein U0821_25855 [Chloroflexota bacterium]
MTEFDAEIMVHMAGHFCEARRAETRRDRLADEARLFRRANETAAVKASTSSAWERVTSIGRAVVETLTPSHRPTADAYRGTAPR